MPADTSQHPLQATNSVRSSSNHKKSKELSGALNGIPDVSFRRLIGFEDDSARSEMIRNRTAEKLSKRGNARLAWSVLAILGAALLFSFARAAAKEVSALTALQEATASTPKLAGHWQLNKDQSDDVRQKMQAARGDSGAGQGEGGNGGGRGQGGREGAGRAQRAGMMDELQTLTIEQTGSNVKITGKSGRVLAQYPS